MISIAIPSQNIPVPSDIEHIAMDVIAIPKQCIAITFICIAISSKRIVIASVENDIQAADCDITFRYLCLVLPVLFPLKTYRIPSHAADFNAIIREKTIFAAPSDKLKKIGYIALLTILLLQAGGILFVYIAQQCYVRFEMREELNDRSTQFEKITLSFADYKKIKLNSDEISYKGKMYDVKSVLIFGDRVELLLIHDSKEENILEAIKDFLQRDNQPNSGFANEFHELQSLKYLVAGEERIFFISSLAINFSLLKELKTVSNDSDISTPPPKTV